MDTSKMSQEQWQDEMKALDKRLKSQYVRLIVDGFVHIRSDEKTVCGMVISRYDWMTIETLDGNRHALCRKCQGVKAPARTVGELIRGKLRG